jgi:hypothetical protein
MPAPEVLAPRPASGGGGSEDGGRLGRGGGDWRGREALERHPHAEGELPCGDRHPRAIDLAVGHLAEFGPDDDLLDCMQAALDRSNVTATVRERFTELRRSTR